MEQVLGGEADGIDLLFFVWFCAFLSMPACASGSLRGGSREEQETKTGEHGTGMRSVESKKAGASPKD